MGASMYWVEASASMAMVDSWSWILLRESQNRLRPWLQYQMTVLGLQDNTFATHPHATC